MKQIAFAFLALWLFVIPGQSQPDKNSQEMSIEIMPTPEGGPDAFNSWIDANNRLKNASDTITENDKVYVQFTVDTTGLLKDIIIVRGLGPQYDKEAYRLVSTCPITWSPAVANGQKTAVLFTMPICFIDVTTKPDNR
jgi:protein TonB